jgi:hypothetical protein
MSASSKTEESTDEKPATPATNTDRGENQDGASNANNNRENDEGATTDQGARGMSKFPTNSY